MFETEPELVDQTDLDDLLEMALSEGDPGYPTNPAVRLAFAVAQRQARVYRDLYEEDVVQIID